MQLENLLWLLCSHQKQVLNVGINDKKLFSRWIDFSIEFFILFANLIVVEIGFILSNNRLIQCYYLYVVAYLGGSTSVTFCTAIAL